LPPETKIVTQTEIQYVDKPVYFYVDKPVNLTDWNSVDELKQFLTDHGVVGMFAYDLATGQQRLATCGEFSYALRDNAEAQGKYLAVESDVTQWYAYCMARVGNQCWFIEPQSNQIWYGGIFK
jgi:hypothetical protein